LRDYSLPCSALPRRRKKNRRKDLKAVVAIDRDRVHAIRTSADSNLAVVINSVTIHAEIAVENHPARISDATSRTRIATAAKPSLIM
jgi:3-deoxy-D-arabino-heptulosonate 7-phosphate (DAHP) synthase